MRSCVSQVARELEDFLAKETLLIVCCKCTGNNDVSLERNKDVSPEQFKHVFPYYL